jgi:hypothetical protein
MSKAAAPVKNVSQMQ